MTAPIFNRPDGHGGHYVYAGNKFLGRVFPAVPGNENSKWLARLPGRKAQTFDSAEEALDYVAGRPVNLEEN